MINAACFTDTKKLLKKTETKGGIVDLVKIQQQEPTASQQETIRDYFFQAGVDEWYNNLKSHTFRSEFTPILEAEAKCIIKHWHDIGNKLNEAEVYKAPVIPSELQQLVERVDHIINTKFGTGGGVFVKLSTRSPKDSKTIFHNAVAAFNDRKDAHGNIKNAVTTQENAKLVALSEETVKAAVVRTGHEAVTILLDSWRVAEDLMYAFEDDKKEFAISLVIREWDSKIKPQCEFRGFVWDRKLNCIGQYWHSLFMPEMLPFKDIIAEDCLRLFDELKDSLPVSNAMLDLAWFGTGQVLLVEVNPLMEGLGSFAGSTGLFDFYIDSEVLTGILPFEIRMREEEENKANLFSHMSPDWRNIVFGTGQQLSKFVDSKTEL